METLCRAAVLLTMLWFVFGHIQAQQTQNFFQKDFLDDFDLISEKMQSVNAENCGIKHVGDLHMNADTVSHVPNIRELNINPVFPNRTAMLHLHNMALSRAFFFSFSLQSRFNRPGENDTYDPGMMYYYLSTVADVASNPKINASAIYFSPKMAYSPSYKGFFNLSFPLFAPRTFRADDYNDPIHLERISTLNMFISKDLGAIPENSMGENYTTDFYRINDWYNIWLPDDAHKKRLQDTKAVYDVRIRYANNTNATFSFHGPPGAEEFPGPVNWTRPYFDCGRSNTWKFAAVVPIADIYPRHTQFRHIEYPSYTAVSVLEMNFDRIDINQCPITQGNPGPNRFADTAKCKKGTTDCEPLHGYGFRRGGYQCRCQPGFRLPNVVRRPYLGEIVERASPNQYNNPGNFQCTKINRRNKMPQQKKPMPYYWRDQYMEQFPEYENYSAATQWANWSPTASHQKRDQQSSLPDQVHKKLNVDEIMNYIQSINADTCKGKSPEDLQLRGDISYGSEEQFENEALMAVRTANFISAFLQVVDPKEIFPGTRVVDEPLTEDQMMGEALAMVMGNSKIWSAGIYFDTSQFVVKPAKKAESAGPQTDPRHNTRTFFAPFAYKKERNTRQFHLEDLARLNNTKEIYINQGWYKDLKSRWSNYFDDLEKHWLKMYFRSRDGVKKEQGQSIKGDAIPDPLYLRRYEHFPEYYRAANIKHGVWTAPRFDCNGFVKLWKITYAVPFFGFNSLRNRIEFKGAVAVSMDMKKMDVNQCPNKYSVPNAFKRTHKCDDKTSYCVPIPGRGFSTGGYKCECKQGYEYPFEDSITYYDGQRLDSEFLEMVGEKPTWFDNYRCRLASATQMSSSFAAILFLSFVMLIIRPVFQR